jgi:hypothetical protein
MAPKAFFEKKSPRRASAQFSEVTRQPQLKPFSTEEFNIFVRMHLSLQNLMDAKNTTPIRQFCHPETTRTIGPIALDVNDLPVQTLDTVREFVVFRLAAILIATSRCAEAAQNDRKGSKFSQEQPQESHSL